MKKTAWQKATTEAGITDTQATNYLNALPPHDQHAINQAKRKDNPNITTALHALKTTNPTTHRPAARRSIGNPTKQPRAGAPTMNGTFQLESLIALKQYATTHGGLDQIQHDLDALRAITT